VYARRIVVALAAVSLVSSMGCSAPDAEAGVPLFEGLGTHHHPITANERGQAYFDQGLRLAYGFNHEESIRSFQTGIEADSGCAMCWWGIAFAAGPNINATMDSSGGALAWSALQEAQARAADVSQEERAYIQALSARYGPDPMADRAARDSAYAAAMGDVARAYPDDDDAQVLYADALMNLAPWDYWNPDLTPRPGTEEQE
jgi:hypothetical protein